MEKRRGRRNGNPGRSGECRIAMLHVGMKGFRTRRGNAERMEQALEVMELLAEKRADLICWPAGYLLMEREQEATGLLAPVFAKAGELGVAVLLGVDEPKAHRLVWGGEREIERMTVFHQMPCYLYGFDGGFHVWRQRSMSTKQALERWSSTWLAEMERSLEIRGRNVEVWLCGECYDRRIQESAVLRAPDAVLISGHFTMPRMMRSMRSLARTGLTIFQTDHRTLERGLFHAACGGRVVSHRNGTVIASRDGLWTEAALWRLTSAGVTPLFF